MGDDAIIPDRDQFTNKTMGLDLATNSNANILLDFNEWSDKSSASDLATININGLDDCHILAKKNIPNRGAF